MPFQLTLMGAILRGRAAPFARIQPNSAHRGSLASRARGAWGLAFALLAALPSFAQTPTTPAPLAVLKNYGGLAPGYLFYTQQKGTAAGNGPVIADNLGRPVWYSPLSTGVAADFRVQSYRGQPVLTWATAASFQNPTSTAGVDYICDANYNVIATVRAGAGLGSDPHEFELTPEGTALVVSYHNVSGDVSAVGGVADGLIMEGVVQEIDVATGAVLLEWHSLGHVGLDESYLTPPATGTTTYDYFHINSAKVAADGNLIVSSRNTWTIFKIDRHTGDILWRLGGKKSDFALGSGLPFAWQHDATDIDGSTIQLFDNGSGSGSRALWVTLDQSGRSAVAARAIIHPEKLFALVEGSTQTLPNGNTLVGYGIADRISEYDPAGTLLYDAKLPSGYTDYRVYRFPWVGHPANSPAAAAYQLEDGTIEVHAIWNGATQVAGWNLYGGAGTEIGRAPIASVPWNGFDTSVVLSPPLGVVRIDAIDSTGTVIESTAALTGPFPGRLPTIVTQPTAATIATGSSLTLTVEATDATGFQWYHSGQPLQDGAGDVSFAGTTTPRLLVQGLTAKEAGMYRCVVSNSTGSVSSSVVNVTVSATAEPGHLVNVSCRANVTAGENQLIAGFVVNGANAGAVPLSVHAMGPSLASYGVPDALSDLQLDLYSLASATPIATSGVESSAFSPIAGGARALAIAPGSDPVLSKILGPAEYTANVTSLSADGGVALVQVDDNSSNAYVAGRSRLINVSGRAHVGRGADVLIAGFVIGGATSRTVLIRASGPTLAAFGVEGALRDPQLDLYTLNGAKVATNRNWQADPIVATVASAVGAFAWPDPGSQDAALLVTLSPGAYTAQVSGANGDEGVALLEVYDVP